MKIIHEGNLEKAKAYKLKSREFRCPACTCDFEALKNEYALNYFTGKIKVQCPFCGYDIVDEE